jgi:diaminopimelate epimerase
VTVFRFAKYEGLGNDFVVVDVDAPDALDARTDVHALAARLCDRHRGIGADGVLLAGVRGGVPFMRVLNADGSEPEMCGNGLRCVALHLARTGRLRADGAPVSFDTGAGPHVVRVHAAGTEGLVEVTMRKATFDPARVPVEASHPLVDAPLDVDGRTLRVTALSLGNPHLVIFEALSQSDRLTLGPRLSRDPRFPAGVNVGFATQDVAGLTLFVHERGVGFTQACGTGACAAAIAAVATGRAPQGAALAVRLPGGVLTVRVDAVDAPVQMTGPARHVFDGTLAFTLLHDGDAAIVGATAEPR